MMAARPGRWLVFTAIFAVAGCSEPDTIRVHDETPPPQPKVREITPDQKKFRTLAAMVPAEPTAHDREPNWWFFKMSGPSVVIGKFESDFDKLLATIQATTNEKDPIVWELPTGWTQSAKSLEDMRFATLKTPGGEAELSVTRFGGSILANAQRWWGELWGKDQEMKFTAAMLPEYVLQRKVKGRLVMRVDMYGPKDPSKRPMMMNPPGGMGK